MPPCPRSGIDGFSFRASVIAPGRLATSRRPRPSYHACAWTLSFVVTSQRRRQRTSRARWTPVDEHRADADPLAQAVERDHLALLVGELVREQADRLDQVGHDDEARQGGGVVRPGRARPRSRRPSARRMRPRTHSSSWWSTRRTSRWGSGRSRSATPPRPRGRAPCDDPHHARLSRPGVRPNSRNAGSRRRRRPGRCRAGRCPNAAPPAPSARRSSRRADRGGDRAGAA